MMANLRLKKFGNRNQMMLLRDLYCASNGGHHDRKLKTINFRMKFKMILAADSKGGIGKGGTLPWEGLYIKFSLTDVPWSDYRTSLDGRKLRILELIRDLMIAVAVGFEILSTYYDWES